MKWIGWIITVFTIFPIIFGISFLGGITPAFIVAMYGGFFSYVFIRGNRDNRWVAVKQMLIPVVILLVGLIVMAVIISDLNQKADEFMEAQYGGGLASQNMDIVYMFEAPSILTIIILPLAFILVPFLAAFLEGITPIDPEGLKKDPWLILLYMILTLSLYGIFWFYGLKKSLARKNIETASLWWFLVPLAGSIVVSYSFSKALEIRTKRSWSNWFLIFFFVQGLDISIIQGILNSDISNELDNPQLSS